MPKVIIKCRPATVPTDRDAVVDEGRNRLTNGDFSTARTQLLKMPYPYQENEWKRTDLSQQEGGDDMVKGEKLGRLPVTLGEKDVEGDPGGFGHWMMAGYVTPAPLPFKYGCSCVCSRGTRSDIKVP